MSCVWQKSVCVLLAALCLGCAAAPTAAPSAAPPASPAINTGPATIVVGQQPCCPKQTLPEFLGLTGLCKAAGALVTRIRARLGMRFPGLEAKPAVLPITDPANAESSNPAVSAASEIKAEEDAAPQKIKGLRYLATIGCGGCYPDVEQALLAGLDDCTEEVRYEAAAALRKHGRQPLPILPRRQMLQPRRAQELQDIAFGVKENTGCYKESSARTRRMARLALAGCCGSPRSSSRRRRSKGPAGRKLGNRRHRWKPPRSPATTTAVGWRLPIRRIRRRFAPAASPLPHLRSDQLCHDSLSAHRSHPRQLSPAGSRHAAAPDDPRRRLSS